MIYIGIDVSKATFVIAYSSVKTNKTRTFKNTVKGVSWSKKNYPSQLSHVPLSHQN